MNIYLVNRYSKYKGPFDIIDSNRKHIIKVGDICLRDSVEGVEFLVVCSSDNSWKACKSVGIGDNSILSSYGNTLLFSFDGLHKRKGNVSLIKQLADCYREKVIVNFFGNAIDILEYKKDFWDVSLFSQFFASSQELISRSESKKACVYQFDRQYPTEFAKYLNKELFDILTEGLNTGNGLKAMYKFLREKEPVLFRTALMKFLAENPTSTIYDKPTFVEISSEPKVEPVVEVLVPIQEEKPHEAIAADEDHSFLLNELNKNKFKKLLDQYHKGDKKALEQLVKANLKLVVGFAREYKGHGVEYEDIVQEGSIGLMKAIEHFNPNRKVQFPIYARWWIHQSILDYIAKQRYLVRLPLNQLTIYRRVQEYIQKFEQENDYQPSITDIEEKIHLDLEKISYLVQLPSDLKEMTNLVDDMDVYECPDSAVEVFEEKDYSRYQAWNYIRVLNKHQRTIVRKFFGIGYKKAETMTIIADEMGYTRERIRQIIEKSLKIMREASLTAIIIDNNYDEQSVGVGGYGQAGAKRDVIDEYKSFLKDTKFKSTKEDKQIVSKEKIETLAPIVKQEEINTNELNGLKVGDILLYKEKIATVKKILLVGSASKLIIKYENDVLDVVTNNPSNYKVLQSHKTDGIRNVVKELRDNHLEGSSDKKQPPALYNYYIDKISKMKQAVVKGERVLAKPALLIAIIDGIKEGNILHNDIVLTKWLEEKYSMLLLHYSHASQILHPTGIEKPFWHLQSDGFWHLKYPQSLYRQNVSPTKKWILDNVECARLDDDLWSLLQNDEWREKICKYIIDNKLTHKKIKIENERKRVIEFPFLPLQFFPEEEIEKKEEKKSEKKEEYPKKEKVLKSGYGLSTPLRNLVDQKIITKVQLKHCRKKGLNTIGDVFQIIEKYHLTPDSTRFTKYTIDIWFAIVNFAKAKVL